MVSEAIGLRVALFITVHCYSMRCQPSLSSLCVMFLLAQESSYLLLIPPPAATGPPLHRRVLGVDATAAQTLSSLAMVLRRMGVELVISRVTNKSIRRLLVAHGIISASDVGGSAAVPEVAGGAAAAGQGDEEQQLLETEVPPEEQGACRIFETLNEAAKYAEDRWVVGV